MSLISDCEAFEGYSLIKRLGLGMTAIIIDGKKVAQNIKDDVTKRVELAKEQGVTPCLATVLVGDDPASTFYVSSKHKACESVGMNSLRVDLPTSTAEDVVIEKVRSLSADPSVHGILVQLPLPKTINERRVLEEVDYHKDVDGFHPQHIGCLALKGLEPMFQPCTPYGCMKLLEAYNIPIDGKRAVVVGRSNIVGVPAALMLQERNATVTTVHSRTPNPEEIIREADIVIAAVGIPCFVQGGWVKPGAAVIDVGINKVDDASRARGYRLVGDVDYKAVSEVAGWISPVPGGVGPMTIAMLLENTMKAAEFTL